MSNRKVHGERAAARPRLPPRPSPRPPKREEIEAGREEWRGGCLGTCDHCLPPEKTR